MEFMKSNNKWHIRFFVSSILFFFLVHCSLISFLLSHFHWLHSMAATACSIFHMMCATSISNRFTKCQWNEEEEDDNDDGENDIYILLKWFVFHFQCAYSITERNITQVVCVCLFCISFRNSFLPFHALIIIFAINNTTSQLRAHTDTRNKYQTG